MTSKTLMIAAGVAGTLMWASGAVQAAATAEPSESELTRAVTHYLSDHGDLCVGKFTWPRVVTQQDQLTHTNDAVQLPVLERLGLVESTEISAPVAADVATNAAAQGSQSGSTAATAETARQYSLTAKGRQYYQE